MDIEKLLTDLYENISDEAVRGNTRIFHTVASIHNSDLAQALLEGYENTRAINLDLPALPIHVFQRAASAAIIEVHKRGKAGAASFWIDNNYKSNPPDVVYLGMKSLSSAPFSLLKTLGLKVINQHLKEAGKAQIIAADAVKGGAVGIEDTAFRRSSHIAHSRDSTVGVARTLLALKALEISNPEFSKFMSTEQAKDLKQIFDTLTLSYSIKSTKGGALILGQVEPVNVSLQASSVNLSKVDTDASKLKTIFSKAVASYIKENTIIPEDILEQDAEDYLLKVFERNIYTPTVKIIKSYTRVAVKKYVKTKTVKGSKNNKNRPVGRRAKLAANRKVRESVTSKRNLALLFQYMKSDLKRTLTERMGPPGRPSTLGEVLSNQTGRFIEGVKISNVSATEQNFLKVQYSYEKPYDTFQAGNAQGSKQRDPRQLIKHSIDDMVESFSKQKGWGSSPFGRIYPIKLNMRPERGR